MSKYLNPKDCPKEVWLFDNGFMIPNPVDLFLMGGGKKSMKETVESIIGSLNTCAKNEYPDEDGDFFKHRCVVELINNGKFRAAAVYTSREEVLANCENLESDPRQRLWFVVDKEKALAEVRPFPSN